jgi:hypothetical protein
MVKSDLDHVICDSAQSKKIGPYIKQERYVKYCVDLLAKRDAPLMMLNGVFYYGFDIFFVPVFWALFCMQRD